MSDILVVDDEVDICDLVAGILEDEGHTTRSANDADSAFARVNERQPDAVILDIWLKGSRMDGIQILKELKLSHPDLPVIVISGHGNIELAVTAMQAGAYDFIEKPLKVDHLLLVVGRALEASNLRRQVRHHQEQANRTSEIIGSSQRSEKLREIAMKAGQGDSRVFIRGAAGSGKEMLARHIHQQSKRTDQPFVVVNLSSGNVEELEVELFGVAGDKTARKVVGALEKAHQGTLYLEEIGQIPEKIQSALLRFLVNGQFTRKDAEGVVSVDCRVISSSMMNAEEIISKGHIRQDLFHRLNVVSVDIPSLHERRDDIPDLLEFFMHQLCMESGRGQRNFGRDAMMVMQAYSWPGNIRQLRNAVENILINMDGDGEINIEHLPPEVLTDAPKVFLDESMREVMKLPLRDAREVFEREYLMAQLTRLNGNVSKTAEFVGMERSALHRKLKLLGLRTNE